MTKKRKGNKKPRTPRVEPLEHLLKAGEPETYGQLCWSLANRDTKRHQAGEVIKLGGWERTGRWTEKRFKLTAESIGNINRCLGIRTCGEASALFTETKELEPLGECPGGHQEAAFQYMMYGIMPTKPCPECGEIPTFQGLAMSLDFKSNGPVKGIDGNEYQICPKCGDDMLELQGSDPVGWGWNVVCTSCGWQTKQAEELDIHQYSDLMEEIKMKVEAIQRLMEMPGIVNQTRVESVCLQLRMVLELTIFSSLVSNKDAWQKSQEELRKAWNIKKIMADLKGIHGRYYPEPKRRVGNFLTEDRLISVHDQLNKVIHAENPLGTAVNLRHYMESVPKWIEWITSLLTEHKVFLYHHPNVFYWVGCSEGQKETSCALPSEQTPTGKRFARGRTASNRQIGNYASTSVNHGRNASYRHWNQPRLRGKESQKPMTNQMQQQADQPRTRRDSSYRSASPPSKGQAVDLYRPATPAKH